MTFDLDAVDDPTHGSQQLTLFHAFYEQYQYLHAAAMNLLGLQMRSPTSVASALVLVIP